MKKAKKAKAAKATFPVEMDLKPIEARIRDIHRKMKIDLDEELLPRIARIKWAKTLTNAQLAEIARQFQVLVASNSSVCLGLWEIQQRLMRRPNATRISPREAAVEAAILARTEPF